MLPLPNEETAIRYVFRSLRRLRGRKRGEDSQDREPRLGARLLSAHRLDENAPISAVVTGSKGKGSVTILAARVLHALGHRVGTLTSPHLVSWFERIRINGRAISEADFCRILSDFVPTIDAIEASLAAHQHLSPQAIFLAVALRHFQEQGVEFAILEVGRGGRFDDVSLVRKRVAAFSPIFREHLGYLGSNLARIAWHKSGILAPGIQGISLPQRPVVRAELMREAAQVGARLHFLQGEERGRWLPSDGAGSRLWLPPYGELRLGLAGRYQVENTALALDLTQRLYAASRQQPAAPFSTGQMVQIRPALATLTWPGRFQILQENPRVILDGAIHGRSARALVASLAGHLPEPVVAILCVPRNKGFRGVYRAIAKISDQWIITETKRNRILPFPAKGLALRLASELGAQATHRHNLQDALQAAEMMSGSRGTILIIGTHSILADAAQHWRLKYDNLW